MNKALQIFGTILGFCLAIAMIIPIKIAVMKIENEILALVVLFFLVVFIATTIALLFQRIFFKEERESFPENSICKRIKHPELNAYLIERKDSCE